MSKKRALVQDDQAAIRSAASSVLALYGFEVDCAEDGVQGMELLKKNHYDIVFTDVEMPNMNGFEFLARAKRDPALKAIPIVMCTTLSQQDQIEKGRQLGAVSYIVKPMNKQTLERALKNAGLLA
mgnify:CR=1 FL=1